MPLTDEAREIIRQATLEALTRRLTPEDVYGEVVRLVNEAATEEQAQAVGFMLGRIAALSADLNAAAPEQVT